MGPDEINIETAVGEIGSGLGFGSDDNTGAGGEGGTDPNLDTGDAGAGDAGSGDDTGAGDPAGGASEQKVEDTPADGASSDASNPGNTPAPKPSEAPRTWKPEVASLWAQVPPAVQAEILRREDDMFKGIEGYKANAKIGEQFNQVIEPYKHILAHFNVDPVQQLSGLMKAHYTLATGTPQQRVELFRRLATSYGVDTAELSKDPPYTDPEVQRLTQSHQALESKFDQTQRELAEERQRAAQREVDAFAGEKDASGQLKYPYFAELEAEIAVQLRGGTKGLKEAYEKAVWANPVTRAKEQQRIQKDAETKRRAEEKAKAEAARKATAANTRVGAKSGSAAAPLGSMDDTLRETLANIQKRS